MKTIIEGLNEWFKDNNREGFFLLQCRKIPLIFKAIKKYEVKLYIIDTKSDQEPILIDSFAISGKEDTISEKDNLQEELRKQCIKVIFNNIDKILLYGI